MEKRKTSSAVLKCKKPSSSCINKNTGACISPLKLDLQFAGHSIAGKNQVRHGSTQLKTAISLATLSRCWIWRATSSLRLRLEGNKSADVDAASHFSAA